MSDLYTRKENLLAEMQKLRDRYELSKTVGPDYFEPGMMEYLDKSYGSYDEPTGAMVLRFESRGTRYEGRTERMENVHLGDEIQVVRDPENPYNSNNFKLLDKRGQNLGNMAATICNALAPLYDSGNAVFEKSFVSFVEPISKRGRHAKQAMLFVELQLRLIGIRETKQQDTETKVEHGETVISAEQSPAEIEQLIEELKKRYPEGSPYRGLDELMSANEDLFEGLVKLFRISKSIFHVSANVYLRRKGILVSGETHSDTSV